VTGYLDRSTIRVIARVLASGGVAVLPTDTIYGFHCAASSRGAVRRILRLKGRTRAEGFILLVSDLTMVSTIVARWPGGSRERLVEIWPARLTAILPAKKGLPPVVAPGGAVAVRIPAHPELRALIKALGEPVISTSVNVSGHAPISSIARIRKAFPGLDAYCSRRGRPMNLPSTIVDFTTDSALLVRAGAYPWKVGS
jgi:L-threonylcarbamoyladenylate synthase